MSALTSGAEAGSVGSFETFGNAIKKKVKEESRINSTRNMILKRLMNTYNEDSQYYDSNMDFEENQLMQ